MRHAEAKRDLARSLVPPQRAGCDYFSFPDTVEPPVSDRPKCQVEAVAYESLDHNGSKFFLIRI